jgi:hypothetical protein
MQIAQEFISGSADQSITTFHQTSVAGDTLSIQIPSPVFETSSSPTNLSSISLSIIGLRDFLNGLYSVTISDTQGRSIKQTFNASFGWFTATELFVLPDLHLALGSPYDQVNNFTVTVTNEEAKPLAIAAINTTNVLFPAIVGSRWFLQLNPANIFPKLI